MCSPSKKKWQEKLKSVRENESYTRAWQLPVNVAFEIVRVERVDNKSKPGTQSNRAIVNASPGLKLMIYLGMKYEQLQTDDCTEMSADILKGEKVYLVSRGGIIALDKIVLDLLLENDVKQENLSVFDPNIHMLHKCDKFGNPVTDIDFLPKGSPAKRQRTE